MSILHKPMDLNPSVPKDLNTLCQCCLEKVPARRLASAAFLREELQRFVNFQPIQSRPSNWRSRVAKWSYRNPIVAALTVVAVAMVGVLLVVSTENNCRYFSSMGARVFAKIGRRSRTQ